MYCISMNARVGRTLVSALCLFGLGAGCGTPVSTDHFEGKLQSFRGDLERHVLLSGRLLAVDSTEIHVPRTPMWTVSISWMIEDGAVVEAGERILEFDNSAVTASIENQRNTAEKARRVLQVEKKKLHLNLIEGKLRVARARIALDEARLEAGVPTKLIGAKKAEDARIVLRNAEAEFEKSNRALQTAQYAADTAIKLQEVELERSRRKVDVSERAIAELVIRAPEKGVVTIADHPQEGRKFKTGDSPWAGLTILRLPQLEHMAVKARLFDVDDGQVKPGMPVSCRLDMYPDRVYTGHVRDLRPIANEAGPFSQRRVFELMIDLDTPDTARMRPGMSVRIDIPRPVVQDVVLAPREAIEIGEDSARVCLAGGKRAEISLGPCSARFCIVEEGLLEGTPLVAAAGLAP